MIEQLRKYFDKTVRDGNAVASGIAIFAQDDELLSYGREDWFDIGRALVQRLGSVAVMIIEPRLPLVDLLLHRCASDESVLVPRDSETRTFLHDIPLIRHGAYSALSLEPLVAALGCRKAILVEGLGIVASGSVTVEQAYIHCSSACHALSVKALLQLIQDKRKVDSYEQDLLEPLIAELRRPIVTNAEQTPGPYTTTEAAATALAETGLRTVELRLVDSVFGNISTDLGCSVLISQTGASLDELSGCIDDVVKDHSSTVGITASSELIAHQAIYARTGAATILHGHPRFSVILSLLCEEEGCLITDCWRECDRIRYLDAVPIVAGEVGAGGLASKVPPVIDGGIAIVYGHGVFATGSDDFNEPLSAMIALENSCRNLFLERLNTSFVNEKQNER